MPFPSNPTLGQYYNRMRPYAKPTPVPSYVSGRGTASKAYVKRAIKKMHEKKYFMKEQSSIAVSFDTHLLVDLSAIPQGDTDLTRDGDSVKLTSLQVRMTWQTGASQSADSYVRVVIFQWFDNSTPTPPLVLGALGAAFDGTTAMDAFYNHDRRRQFRVLYDNLSICGGSSDPAVASHLFRKTPVISFTPKIKGKRTGKKAYINFVGGGTTAQNKIYLLAISNIADGTNTEPVLLFNSKLNFIDI